VVLSRVNFLLRPFPSDAQVDKPVRKQIVSVSWKPAQET
jgi:hypothetical protein